MILNPKAIKHIVLDGNSLTLESFVAVARYGATVELADSALEAMKKSRALAEKIAAEGRVAYGITTGFGDFQRVAVSKEMSNTLSTNLIISHCTAMGDPYTPEVSRGMLLLRANALCVGVSGVRPILVQMMIEMLNKGVTPIIPQKGSLGSSGRSPRKPACRLPMCCSMSWRAALPPLCAHPAPSQKSRPTSPPLARTWRRHRHRRMSWQLP